MKRKPNPKGFSLRDNLVNVQGVTSEDAVKLHLNVAYQSIIVAPHLDMRHYRVNPNNPNCLGVYSA